MSGGKITNLSEEQQVICSIIPSLDAGLHKGQAGRVGVIGGSREYTGAPYFAAISAMKTGADLAFVFCSADSSTVIKSYSPELIVIPTLNSNNEIQEISDFFPRLHSLVIGPGLGRNEELLTKVGSLILLAKKQDIPLVFDADALFFISKNPHIVHGYTKAILTPNKAEFALLYTSVFKNKQNTPTEQKEMVENLARALGNVTILRKGIEDIISDGRSTFVCNENGSPRRCGGQGDLLSGSIGIFTHWSHSAIKSDKVAIKREFSPTIIAALAASMLTRRCARLAFLKHGRSTTTTMLLKEIKDSFASLYPVD